MSAVMCSTRLRFFLRTLCVLFIVACSPSPTTSPNFKKFGCEASQYKGNEKVERPFHDNSDGLAISPNGTLAALTLDESPANQIAIVNLDSLDAHVVTYLDQRYTLDDPAFSIDGQTLAVVASPSGRHGVAKILLLSSVGKVLEELGEPSRGYRFPAFSPDGTRLGYWKDVATPPLSSSGLKPEDRQLLPWALFELNLATATETQLSDNVYGSPCGLNYDTQQDGIYYCAREPLQSLRDKNGMVGWVSIDGAPDSRKLADARTFYFKRGEKLHSEPEPVFAKLESLSSMAKVRSVTKDGAVLFESSIPDSSSPASFSSAAIWCRSKSCTLALTRGGLSVWDPVATADGSRMLAKIERLDKSLCRRDTEYLLYERGHLLKSFRAKEIRTQKIEIY